MKRIICLFFLLLPAAAFAQSPQTMGQGGTDAMAMMQKMQECMEKIDQSQLEEISKKSAQVGQEVNKLCRQGRKEAAQAKAMAWSKEVRSYPVLRELAKCQAYAGNNPAFSDMLDPAKDFAKKNICDHK